MDAVVYAFDLAAMQRFYVDGIGLTLVSADADAVVLHHEFSAVTLVQVPASVIAAYPLEDPVVRREDTPIKLTFEVAAIAAVRDRAARFGGSIDSADREWEMAATRYCDGVDPEGNVIQLRQVT